MASTQLSQLHYFRWLLSVIMALTISGCEQSTSDAENHEKIKILTQNTGSAEYPFLDWGALTPSNWDANALLKDIDLSKMEDDDPRAFELLKDVREQWNNAPVIKSLDGKAITINGYVALLDGDAEHVKEFLLVPYFGACIHSPPPPSNQVIHVHVAGKGIPFSNWDASVSVSGSMIVAQSDSVLGTAGYQMQADIVKPITDIGL
jgi:uncharacterized protein